MGIQGTADNGENDELLYWQEKYATLTVSL